MGPFCVPLPFPAQHLVAGNLLTCERRADEIGNDAEILGDDLGARFPKDLQHALAERV